MDRDFAVLTEYVQSGHDIIVPSPNMQDLYGQYEHNYWEKVNNERKQVIYHNIGTGLARIPFEYIKYIQRKFDALKALADSNGGADEAANGMEEKKDAADDAGDANQEVVDMDIEEDYVVVQKDEESEEQVKDNEKKAETVEDSNDQSKAAEANTDDANVAEKVD